MEWISVEDNLPEHGESVVAMRADGWWGKIMWTKTHGWYAADYGGRVQPIVKWLRVTEQVVPKSA